MKAVDERDDTINTVELSLQEVANLACCAAQSYLRGDAAGLLQCNTQASGLTSALYLLYHATFQQCLARPGFVERFRP